MKDYLNKPEFQRAFKLLQSLAFVPVSDIHKAFDIIKPLCPAKFETVLKYFKIYEYII
jgi:hypothetical protein